MTALLLIGLVIVLLATTGGRGGVLSGSGKVRPALDRIGVDKNGQVYLKGKDECSS